MQSDGDVRPSDVPAPASEADGEAAVNAMSPRAARERRPFASALRTGRAASPQSSEGVVAAASSTLATGAAAVWSFLRNGH
jgi:hypothetical protein